MPAPTFTYEIEIKVSRALLHSFLCDLHNYLTLHPLIASIEELPSSPERPAAQRYRVIDRIPIGPLRIRTSYIAELEPVSEGLVRGRAWQWPGVRLTTEYELRVVAAGTQLVERVAVDAPRIIRSFVTQQARRAHEETLEKMKALLEEGWSC